MNLPNRITFSRIIITFIFIPVLLMPGVIAKISALLLFTLAAMTDLYDGWLAKKKNVFGGKSLLLKSDKPLVCAHICNIDAQGSSPAQNNLNNIQLNLNNNIDIIEMDVQITKDNVPVLFHDSTLNSVTNGSGRVQDKTWAELSQVRYNSDSTQGITKLADAIDIVKMQRRELVQ